MPATAHIRLKPVQFLDNGLALAWRFRMSLTQLDNESAGNGSERDSITRLPPLARGRAAVETPCAAALRIVAVARETVDPLFHEARL